MADRYTIGPTAAGQIRDLIRRPVPLQNQAGVRADSIRPYFPGFWAAVGDHVGTDPLGTGFFAGPYHYAWKQQCDVLGAGVVGLQDLPTDHLPLSGTTTANYALNAFDVSPGDYDAPVASGTIVRMFLSFDDQTPPNSVWRFKEVPDRIATLKILDRNASFGGGVGAGSYQAAIGAGLVNIAQTANFVGPDASQTFPGAANAVWRDLLEQGSAAAGTNVILPGTEVMGYLVGYTTDTNPLPIYYGTHAPAGTLFKVTLVASSGTYDVYTHDSVAGAGGAQLAAAISPDVGSASSSATVGIAYIDSDGTIKLFVAIDPSAALVPCTVSKTGGGDGTPTAPPTWVYSVSDIPAGNVVLTGASPAWNRADGSFTPATHGTGYWSGSTFVLWQVDEVEILGDC